LRIKFELSDVEAFVVLSRHFSYGKAAKELGVSPSALTRRIQRLEQSLSAELVRRSTRKVQLTLAGERVLQHVTELMGSVDELFLALRGEALRPPPEVTVASALSVTNRLLPRAIERFRAKNQNVHIRVLDCTAREIMEAVRTGEADFGVHYLGSDDPELEFQPIFTERFVVAVHKDHWFANRASVAWRELKDETFISLWKGSGVRMIMDFELARYNLSIKSSCEVHHAHTAANFAEAGLGVAALPELVLPVSSELKGIPLVEPSISRMVGIVRHTRRGVSRLAQEFIRTISDTSVQGVPLRDREPGETRRLKTG
jgi:DNA-binding transcriptional LysR family regulator